ncbi:MAG: hypothetical protein KatS3mg010_0277 [Acidimicrobiia bacterium]|nr:MAG: hypothetical protein KatS3mg010_0277 [Acidimicrobiia bacterium]
MPVLIVSEKTWPHVGFSRNRSIVPSSRVMTMPNSTGFSTRFRPIETKASASRCAATICERSTSVSTSPEITRNVSSSSCIAFRTEPAVPRGDSSVAYRIRTPKSEPSPK